MATIKKPISEATRDELLSYARLALGMQDLAGNISRDAVLSHVVTALGSADATIEVATPDAPSLQAGIAPGAATPPRAAPADEPMVSLTIHEGRDEDGKRPVFVAVNGRGILLPRGQKITIKWKYFHVLENAVQTHFSPNLSTGEVTETSAPLYPYNVHSLPTQAEIDAWRATEAERERKLAA